MIKGVIAALAFIVVVTGGYSLYAFYQKLQNNDIVIEESPVIIPPKESFTAIPKVDTTKNTQWLQNTEQITKVSNYQFPANILDIAIEVKRERDLKIDPTKVAVKNLDDYKFFCLNEILRQRHIDFSYFKNQDSLNLLLFVPDETKRKTLLKDFEYYEIEYEINLKT
ncbi:hypothetical protein CQA66_03700 [Helicobacter aurati]|uniref:Periplasmic protein n=1 Tax=Helicobacter aurati TaxID=137778 RepID=A0A3D8J5L0_9HELI|nr:hypothetical protein CQA66_03700 [Helicobacter aurati]